MSLLFNAIAEPWRGRLKHLYHDISQIESYLISNSYLPSFDLIFKALNLPLEEVKVVIIGQDPYPSSYATGLAFSVPESVKVLPPSLRNIFKELHLDTGVTNTSGDLTPWSEQGVLLLNRILTVTPGKPLSHALIGWQKITYEIVKIVAVNNPVAILWGEKASEFSPYFNPLNTITSSHPSPLSARRSFLGSKPFSKCNKLLLDSSKAAIDWRT